MKRQDLAKRLPLVSVCITSYNYGRYIGAAIRSALTQSYPNVEVVVSDNGSSDDTFEVLEAFRHDPRVKVYITPEPLTMVQHHNAVVRYAEGEYIVLLSADDILLSHHVETLMTRLQDRCDPVDLVYAKVTYGDANLAPLGNPDAHGIMPIAYSNRDEFASMMYLYTHAFPATLLPRSAFHHIGYFDETLQQAFEVDFALRLELAGYKSAVLCDVVAVIRTHSDAHCGVKQRDWLAYHREKLQYIEKYLAPEFAWRFEYIGRHVANVLEFERARIAEGMLDQETLAYSQRVIAALRSYAQTHAEWPGSRPRVSVVVHTHGATKQLTATLESLWSHYLGQVEVVVVQTKGLGVGHLLLDQPYSHSLRYIKAYHLKSSGGVLRLGIELARAPYVAYLEEGQLLPQDQLASLVYGLEVNGADFVYTDASSIHTTHSMQSSGEEGNTQFIPVQRGEIVPVPGEITFAQMLLRRNLLIGTVLFDALEDVGEQHFIDVMKLHFQYVYFERRNIGEFVSVGSGQR